MRLITYKCPECGANVKIEQGLKYWVCDCCGSRIEVEDDKKETTYNYNYSYTNRYINEAKVIEAKSNDKHYNAEKIFGIALIVVPLILGIIFFFIMAANSNNEDRQLEALHAEIQVDINNGEYTEARMKANRLHYTSGYSDDLKKKWDDARKNTLKIIDEKEREAEKIAGKNKGLFGWFG